MNLLDVQQFETYVSACAKNCGVSVTWDKANSVPRTDGKRMWLPAISSKTSAEWLTRMRYFVKHETSHVVHSDFELLQKERPQGLLALINNLVEDHRVDYLNDMEYQGDAVISNDFWMHYCEDVRKNTESTDKELTDQQMLTLPLFVWDAMNRGWISSSDEFVHTLMPHIDEVGSERLLALLKYSEELIRVRSEGSGEDVMELSKRILKDVFGEDAEPYITDGSKSGEKKSEGDAVGEAEGEGDKGEGEEDGDKSSKKDAIINVDKLMEKMMHKHEVSRTGTHMNIEFGGSSYEIPYSSEYRVCYFDRPLPVDVSAGIGSSDFASRKVSDIITNNARPLANKLRIKLQTRSRDRYEYGKRKGNLHNGSLHRVLSGDDNNASRIFRKRVVSDTLDTAVCLLVDCSGSMSGSKFEMACATAGSMAEALKPLNISYSVYGFTNTYAEEHPVIWMFTEYGERVSQQELVKRFAKVSGGLLQNSDGDAIAYASARLLQRKEHRKVLLVLSDGSPCGRDHKGDIRTYTKNVIRDAELRGVDVYGVGIMDMNVRKFYKKNVVVENLSDLSKTILSILDRSI
jgi:hypothetical protein